MRHDRREQNAELVEMGAASDRLGLGDWKPNKASNDRGEMVVRCRRIGTGGGAPRSVITRGAVI